MTCLDVTPKSTEHNLIERIGKSEAEATTCNDKRLRSRYVTVTTDRHEASRGHSAKAEFLVKRGMT